MSEKWRFRKSAASGIGKWIRNTRVLGLKIRKADSGGDETYQRQLSELLKLIEKARMLRQ